MNSNKKTSRFSSTLISEWDEKPEGKNLLKNELKIESFAKPETVHKFDEDFSNFDFETIDEVGLMDISEEVQISIITATDVEKWAVLNIMLPLPNKNKIMKGYKDNLTYFVGMIGLYPIVLTKSEPGTYRPLAIPYVSLAVFNFWKPKIAILCGIAFGADEEKQKIGDILIPDWIIPYEMEKFDVDKNIDRGHRPECSELLKNHFKEESRWSFPVQEEKKARKINGPFLCGEKLFNNKQQIEALKSKYPDSIGGDMESAVFLTYTRTENVAGIVIKAICDFGHDKNDDFQLLAARSSVSLIHSVFQDPFVFDELGVKSIKS